LASQSLPVCRVLYIEDTQEDQQILREAINFADVPVELVTAATAASALKLLSTGALFHVLVLDWNLPAVTGVEFLACVRAVRPTVPILILTGEPRLVDAAAAANFGATTILKKPLVLEEWEQLACQLYKHCDDHSVKAAART
jgi:DNA-binding response OmpR family regulator